jgi:hypothetical protein
MAIIDEVIAVNLNLDGYKEKKVFLYVSLIRHYNIILGILWVRAQDVYINGL